MARKPLQRYIGALFGDAVRSVITLAIVLLIVYLILSALYGYRVGRTIYEAKAHSPFVAIASSMVGREETEQYAINRLAVPKFIVRSPTFWLTLRLSE